LGRRFKAADGANFAGACLDADRHYREHPMTNIEDSALPPAAVLAVDDHPANLLALSAIFETLDIELVTAA
jgi:hypothetical protein